MPGLKLACFLSLAPFALAGCGADEDDMNLAPANTQISAEGKAEEGKISVKAPGFELKFSLPKEMTGEVKVDRDSRIFYPDATISGMAVAAGRGGDDGGGSEVEFRFASADPVDRVLAWYRSPARSDGYRLDGAAPEGDAWVITGTQKRDGHRFKVRLAARGGGGTDGRVTVRHDD
ncbi:MAG TPA: hypothetical protein VGD66_07735 [Allosphingosinicella sp.]|jgi:hypothetical protein